MNKSIDYTQNDFECIRQYIKKFTGISLSNQKYHMVYTRLYKHLKDLGLSSFSEYCKIISSNNRGEAEHLINLITTKQTHFFREPHHFHFLTNIALPKIVEHKLKSDLELRVWSAGCASGEEAYSILITCLEFLRNTNSPLRLKLIASDIDTQALQQAREGIYSLDAVSNVLKPQLEKYFLRGKGKNESLVRIKDDYRWRLSIKRINLNEPNFDVANNLDIIFCRNVMIYFDAHDNDIIVSKFYDLLATPGYLFIGHSETVNTRIAPYRHCEGTIYEKAPVD